jgi:hypothetical protein
MLRTRHDKSDCLSCDNRTSVFRLMAYRWDWFLQSQGEPSG